MNIELLNDVLEFIKKNPELWTQEEWHHRKKHSFAGFIQLRALDLPFTSDLITKTTVKKSKKFCVTKNKILDDLVTYSVARDFAGLSRCQASVLFFSMNTLDDLEIIVHLLAEGVDTYTVLTENLSWRIKNAKCK